MRFEFDYPALVSAVPKGTRNARNVIVRMRGEADIPEVPEAAAPVASRFEWNGREHVHRYIDGAFYLSDGLPLVSRTSLPFSASDMLATALFREMACGSERQEAKAWPWEAHETLFVSGLIAGSGLTVRKAEYVLSARSGVMLEAANGVFQSTEGLTSFDGEDIAIWRDRAAEVVSANVVIDGKLWMRVSEPLLELSQGAGILLANVDVYGQPGNRLVQPPEPFGSKIGQFGNYWKPVGLRPLTDFGSAGMSAAEAATFDIRMPEVFGKGLAFLELERQSRLAVVAARRTLFSHRRWNSWVSSELRAAYVDLRDAVHPANARLADGDRLADLAETLVSCWRDDLAVALRDGHVSMWATRSATAEIAAVALRDGHVSMWETRSATAETAAATEAVERWRERPIEIAEPLAGTPMQPRF